MPVITSCAGCGKHPMTVEGVDKLPAFCDGCRDLEDARRKWLDLTLEQRIDNLKGRIAWLEEKEKEREDGKAKKPSGKRRG